jgi:hypothetical protein
VKEAQPGFVQLFAFVHTERQANYYILLELPCRIKGYKIIASFIYSLSLQ